MLNDVRSLSNTNFNSTSSEKTLIAYSVDQSDCQFYAQETSVNKAEISKAHDSVDSKRSACSSKSSRHKRSRDTVLEDVTNRRPRKGKGQPSGSGKENDLRQVLQTKSRSFANPKTSSQAHSRTDLSEEDDDVLPVEYVSDINSLLKGVRPESKTYYKCSLYSPSNRLYTVNEEVNSTQSDMVELSALMSNHQRISQMSD